MYFIINFKTENIYDQINKQNSEIKDDVPRARDEGSKVKVFLYLRDKNLILQNMKCKNKKLNRMLKKSSINNYIMVNYSQSLIDYSIKKNLTKIEIYLFIIFNKGII
jgi:hypothetical protein